MSSTLLPAPARSCGSALAREPWRIAATVLAFIAWWPLGLAMLLLWKGAALFDRFGRSRDAQEFIAPFRGSSGNSAFDEYRDAVLRRLEEERRRLEEDRRAFGDFLEQLKRAKDREEFDRFMAGRSAPGA